MPISNLFNNEGWFYIDYNYNNEYSVDERVDVDKSKATIVEFKGKEYIVIKDTDWISSGTYFKNEDDYKNDINKKVTILLKQMNDKVAYAVIESDPSSIKDRLVS